MKGQPQGCGCGQDDLVKGVDGLAGGLHPQMVCQIESLDRIIKGRGTIVGCTGGVGQGMWVNGRNWAILIVDVGGKFCILWACSWQVRAFFPPQQLQPPCPWAGVFLLPLPLDHPCCCCGL